MKTAIFWLAWAIVSVFVLRTFYFRYSENRLKQLRYSAIVLELIIVALFTFPWLPDGTTGFGVILTGHLGIITALILLVIPLTAFFSASSLFLKSGVLSHGMATVVFFVSMILLIPGTVMLTTNMIAPIVAAMLMLINIVIGLSLWQQLQLKERANL
ncbi:MAG: hypothetical protein HYT12_04610 [Candidatus Liptonbacteria bacterium]|nr:hypothetical protein [Candidatus Liptonbacteria bacterium]